MDLNKDIHCFICFGVLPFGDVHRPFPQNPEFLEKFFQVNSQQFLADSLLCSKCQSQMTSMVDTFVKILELESTLESLKAEFERNLIGGFELSQKTQKGINRRLGTSYVPGESLDTFYAGRCALVKDLDLIPTIVSKIETSFQSVSEEIHFEDFEEVPSPADEEPLEDPQEDLTPDFIDSQPIKESTVLLNKLELPPNQTRFILNDLNSGKRPQREATKGRIRLGRPMKVVSHLNQVKRSRGRPRINEDTTYLKRKSNYEKYKTQEKAPPIKCTFEGCSYRSRLDFRMKKHVRLTHMKGLPKQFEFKCPTCDFTAKWRSRLLIHQRSHEEIPSICDTCGKSYRNEASLKMHVSEMHTVRPKTYLCTYCPKTFISKGRITQHLKTHTRERVICDVCGKDFAIQRALDEHREKEHEGKGVKCEICEKVLINKQSYDLHIKTHSKTFDHLCPECPKLFISNNSLQTHIDTFHRGVKKYECTICSRRFAHSGSYKSHVESHTKTAHSCSVCLKSFFRLDCLRKHEEIHAGTKYSCPICFAVFNTTKYLSQHVNKTTCKVEYKIWKEAKGSNSKNILKDLATTTSTPEPKVKKVKPKSGGKKPKAKVKKPKAKAKKAKGKKKTKKSGKKKQNPKIGEGVEEEIMSLLDL